MTGRHVTDQLSAFADGELPHAEARAVAEHLLRCERCRAEYDAVRFAASLAARVEPERAPDGLWERIEAAAAQERERPAAGGAGAASRRSPRPTRRVLSSRLAAAAAVVAAFALAAVWYAARPGGPSWRVTALDGAPRVDAARVHDAASMREGETLETDAASRAEIRVGMIGFVDVEPNSRVRMVEASAAEHRIALDRGTLHARIWAPPRLFFVDTPSAVAVDYGCAYTLAVDDAGASVLHVTLGWVALERGGRSSLVPAGALCATRPGVGPGTPYFDDASERLRAALARFDFEAGGDEALEIVLAEARPRDSLSLFYLLERTAGAARERVYDRLASLAPPPRGVDRRSVLDGDPEALDRWRDALDAYW